MANVKPKKALLYIEDGTLLAMAGNKAIIKEFGFLASLTAVQKGCGGCGARRDPKVVNRFNEAKRVIAGLPSDRRNRLKDLLNTLKARLRYRNAAGKAIEVTF